MKKWTIVQAEPGLVNDAPWYLVDSDTAMVRGTLIGAKLARRVADLLNDNDIDARGDQRS